MYHSVLVNTCLTNSAHLDPAAVRQIRVENYNRPCYDEGKASESALSKMQAGARRGERARKVREHDAHVARSKLL